MFLSGTPVAVAQAGHEWKGAKNIKQAERNRIMISALKNND
jgi:hypothetical protein